LANKIIFIEDGQIQYNGTMDSFMLNFPRWTRLLRVYFFSNFDIIRLTN
jgi:ABC-type uncharacterized transport system ATPase subunit